MFKKNKFKKSNNIDVGTEASYRNAEVQALKEHLNDPNSYENNWDCYD